MSTPSITTSGSRRRSHAKPRGRRRSRSRRQQARSLAEQLRAEQVTSPSSSVLRGNRRRSTQPTQQHENVPLSKRAPVKVSRATLMAFYGGIGIASEGTKALQEGRLPARGKTLSTLGYSTIHHEKPRVGTATTTAAATTDTATGADTQEQTGEGKVGNAGAGESTSAGGQEAKKPVLLSVPHCEEIRLQHLFMATVRGDEEVVKRFLDAGEPADSRPARFPNETPLHAAALLGNVSMMEILIKAGARVNSTDMNGNTPLHYAIRANNKEAVELLLTHQADVSARNRLGLNGNRLATELEFRDIAKLLPTSKQLALRRIRTAGRLRAMMGSLKQMPLPG